MADIVIERAANLSSALRGLVFAVHDTQDGKVPLVPFSLILLLQSPPFSDQHIK